jgi:hypothetical protein
MMMIKAFKILVLFCAPSFVSGEGKLRGERLLTKQEERYLQECGKDGKVKLDGGLGERLGGSGGT